MRITNYLSKISGFYSILCVIVVNLLLIVLVFNYWTGTQLKSTSPYDSTENAVADKWVKKYGMETLRKVYAGKSDGEIRKILQNTSVLGVAWHPWVLFQSAPAIKPYYAVHKEGFRFVGVDQGPWPLDRKNYNVFFFGGSTTYGAGVPDVETIPAYFQKDLEKKANGRAVKVYNFGTGAYISTQEMLRFQELVWQGHIPDAVIFLDGLNDFQLWDGTPAHADRYVHVFENTEYANRQDFGYFMYWSLRSMPMIRWLDIQTNQWKKASLLPKSSPSAHVQSSKPSIQAELAACHKQQAAFDRKYDAYRDPVKINTVITRYTNNLKIIEAIASAFHIDAYYVWQPIPTYEYDRCYSPFHDDLHEHYRSRFGYPVMAKHVAEHPMPRGFIWCADLQKGIKKNLYVDHVHYNATMNRMIASCITNKFVMKNKK